MNPKILHVTFYCFWCISTESVIPVILGEEDVVTASQVILFNYPLM